MTVDIKRIVCPKGHSEMFEVVGHHVLTSYPAIYVTRYQCLTCSEVFENQVRQVIKPEIIDYTEQPPIDSSNVT